MSTGNNDSERVARYLDGELNEQQIQAFEAELKKNLSLQEELRLQQKAEKLILEHFEEERQKKLWASYKELTKDADIVEKPLPKTPNKTIYWLKRISIAATIIAATYFVFLIATMPTTNDIIQFGIENRQLVEVERTKTPAKINTESSIAQLEKEVNENPTLLKQLELSDLYLENQQYEKAKMLLEQMHQSINNKHPKYYDIQWALANTYLVNKQYDKAIQNYQEVIDNNALNETKLTTAKKHLRTLKIKQKLGLL